MENHGLLFIPDISGFTKFVTENEIEHSNHIIAELIELLLEANSVGLQVAEIEGDAVLFYKQGVPPDVDAVLAIAEKMFIDFHSYLKIIERDNVCQCGACRTVNDLTLKFICHFGELSEAHIHHRTKIMGSAVILAHKLLKNSVPGKEYILFTDEYLLSQKFEPATLDHFDHFRETKETIDNFGDVPVQFLPLHYLHQQVPEPEQLPPLSFDGKPVEFRILINAPIKKVHQKLIDIETKNKWALGVREIRTDHKLNRVNSSHVCVFEDQEIIFVTIKNQVEGDARINYVEKASSSLGVNFVNDFKLESVAQGTALSLRIVLSDADKLPAEAVEGIQNSMNATLESFKKFCEA